MDIRFVSSLTADDEARLAAALVSTIKNFLDPFPIFYTIRIETSDTRSFQHTHSPSEGEESPVSRPPRASELRDGIAWGEETDADKSRPISTLVERSGNSV
jgi:hypothetical protein